VSVEAVVESRCIRSELLEMVSMISTLDGKDRSWQNLPADAEEGVRANGQPSPPSTALDS
jgi:hypothetical protein